MTNFSGYIASVIEFFSTREMLQNLTAYRLGIIILFTVEPTRLYMELSGAGNSGNKLVNIILNPELPKV